MFLSNRDLTPPRLARLAPTDRQLVRLAVLAMCACGQPRPPVSNQQATDQRGSAVTPSADMNQLISSLQVLPGRFVRGRGPAKHWEFEGDQAPLMALQLYGDSAVVRLVQCLADDRPALASVGGRPVLVGAMCYWALVGIAYYEWYEDNPGASSWPGEIGPTASASQLKAAQKAWEAVVRARRYRLT